MNAKHISEKRERFTGSLLSAHDQLYYYALQLTEDQDDAEDLVQETSYKALKNISRLKYDQHKNAWLYTILRNTYINNLRSGHNKNIKMNRADQNAQVTSAMLPEVEHPDRIFERKELMEKIRCLPALYAKPLKLFLAGYAYKEISNMTDAPIGTVKSRIHLAKEKLKRAYQVGCDQSMTLVH
ncbi:MAG: sigma-70 family RNA polymerase sigma factor [Bacteroidales bacterium]|nr:sigma-70 family RNA polymerase sigma factor [Bacteroidales bacterium]